MENKCVALGNNTALYVNCVKRESQEENAKHFLFLTENEVLGSLTALFFRPHLECDMRFWHHT